MANIRLFTAVSVSPEAQDALRDILGKVAKFPSGIRWVTPQQFHITLQFLGEREEFLVPKLLEVFRILAERYRPFDMALGGLDGFPRLVQARVLFVPVILGQEGLAALAEDMVRVTQPLGIPPEERDFHAHLTLGRVKSAKGVREAVEILQKTCPERFGETRIDRFTLFKSQLGSQGSVYTPLREFELKG